MTHTFRLPILTVDAVVLTLICGKLMVVLMKRHDEPFAGQLALLGGGVRDNPEAGAVDESSTAAMLRILKGSLGAKPNHLEQVYTASGPGRDPRGWSASVVHLALYHHESVQALVDTGAIELHEVLPRLKAKNLAFDHKALIETAVARLQAKATYSTIAAHLLPKIFKLPDLHDACEAITGEPRNRDNFRRKILKASVLVEAGMIRNTGGKPAQGYKLRESIALIAGPAI